MQDVLDARILLKFITDAHMRTLIQTLQKLIATIAANLLISKMGSGTARNASLTIVWTVRRIDSTQGIDID